LPELRALHLELDHRGAADLQKALDVREIDLEAVDLDSEQGASVLRGRSVG
jgi:hypothetical protein